eukprot:SAG11_NODE_6610_length_1279_cov_2.032203_3_plen_128_part_00
MVGHQVSILDFNDTQFINFEAEINFPEDEGIIQVENFGMHYGVDGKVIYGMKIVRTNRTVLSTKDSLPLSSKEMGPQTFWLCRGCIQEAIMDRGADDISIDQLSRLLVDVHLDSSKITESLISAYQV